tara:strand:- start:2795 stop:3688 length:894 start_codon:yes stop_codon:yes gene_type:complete
MENKPWKGKCTACKVHTRRSARVACRQPCRQQHCDQYKESLNDSVEEDVPNDDGGEDELLPGRTVERIPLYPSSYGKPEPTEITEFKDLGILGLPILENPETSDIIVTKLFNTLKESGFKAWDNAVIAAFSYSSIRRILQDNVDAKKLQLEQFPNNLLYKKELGDAEKSLQSTNGKASQWGRSSRDSNMYIYGRYALIKAYDQGLMDDYIQELRKQVFVFNPNTNDVDINNFKPHNFNKVRTPEMRLAQYLWLVQKLKGQTAFTEEKRRHARIGGDGNAWNRANSKYNLIINLWKRK